MAEKKTPEKAKIHLFQDDNRYSGDVFVGLNGIGYNIKRGVDVEVPKGVAEILENQARAREEATRRSTQLQSEFEEETRRRFG